MDVENDFKAPDNPEEGLESRPPTLQDLVDLCRRLNETGARYVVIGGFAIIEAGLPRTTMDIDLLIDSSRENEACVFHALEGLPDKAVRELQPGDIARYVVVRIADEIVVDLMHSACGIDYAEGSLDMVTREVGGVPIPFASPRLLWRTKVRTHREKDHADLVFLREYFSQRGEQPPD